MAAGILFTTFGQQIIQAFTGQVLSHLIQSPQVQVERKDVPEVKPVVEKAVEQAMRTEIIPRVEHLTNQEPWYQSRVTLGALSGILGGTATLLMHFASGEPLSVDTYGPPVMAILGGITTLWGRWAATKPLTWFARKPVGS